MNKLIKIVCLTMCFLFGMNEGLIQASSSTFNAGAVQYNVIFKVETPKEYDLVIDGIYYQITSLDNLELQVVGGKNVYSGEIVIPDEVVYKGKKFLITAIGDKCFYESPVTNVKIGDNISTIRPSAFEYSDIKEIVIPPTVKKLYDTSFDHCVSLKKIIFLDGTDVLEFLGSYDSTFFGFCPVEYLYIGRNIDVSTRFWVFSNLSNAIEIKIGSTVTELARNLLSGASKITSLTIPKSVKKNKHRCI